MSKLINEFLATSVSETIANDFFDMGDDYIANTRVVNSIRKAYEIGFRLGQVSNELEDVFSLGKQEGIRIQKKEFDSTLNFIDERLKIGDIETVIKISRRCK